jgi:pimeloyl-ACP methyl ester carboxylesterase
MALISPLRAGKSALTIFSTPRKGRYREGTLPSWLMTADEQLVNAYQGEESRGYFFQADGPVILLAHGWESNSGRWEKLKDALLEIGYSVLMVDAPAHGASGGTAFSAVKYAGFMQPYCDKYNPVAIVGHSAGAMAAMYLTTQLGAPSVNSLFLLGMPVKLTTLLKSYCTFLGLSRRVSQGLNSAIFKTYNEHPEWFDMADFAEKLTGDGLLLHDPKDGIAPYSEIESVAKLWQRGTLIEMPGEGHSLRSRNVIDTICNSLGAVI